MSTNSSTPLQQPSAESAAVPEMPLETPPSGSPSVDPPKKSVSILRRRWRKFKSLKRGYYSFILLIIVYLVSFACPLLINSKALIVSYNGELSFPALSGSFYSGKQFGQTDVGEAPAQFRALGETWRSEGSDNWVLMPPYSWDPYESDFESSESHPQAPSGRHLLGTDDTGRDVFARMAYGFNVSISFALLLTVLTYIIGVTVGALMGYYGGKFDLFFQRFIEVWSNLPSIYVIIIVSSIVIPNFVLLVLLLVAFGWIGMTYYMRGEFYREKAKDYVAAAISLGASDRTIIFKHILPNALTPIIASFPFAIIGGIASLVGLDYLGFGLPPPTPSWGQMVNVGLQNVDYWWLVLAPLGAEFIVLLMVTFIGEAIREAFDPKVFSRLR